jgi:hypothetical protein
MKLSKSQKDVIVGAIRKAIAVGSYAQGVFSLFQVSDHLPWGWHWARSCQMVRAEVIDQVPGVHSHPTNPFLRVYER